MASQFLNPKYIKNYLRSLLAGLLIVLFPVQPVLAEQNNYLSKTDVHAFIDEMVVQHNFNKKDLARLFSKIRLRPDIIKAISRPAEGLPWYKYRPIFMKKSRIEGGVTFWNQHAVTLARAEKVYGVPPEIIVAIIGVESFYGKHKGKHLVMEALATLAFDYPKRSRFFRSELEQYLLLTREEKIDPLSLKGSYAGAMGEPQFISSSYRHYAVDFDQDGKRDLWNNTVDIIGSVANYFSRHGWKPGQTISTRAIFDKKTKTSDKKIRSLVKLGVKPKHSLEYIKGYGVTAKSRLADDQLAALIKLTTKNEPEYWLGLHNFYVITRYNHSELYAMAVFQLGNEIVKLRNKK